MTVNQSRSQKGGLLYGATEGKYRRLRPDTEVTDALGDRLHALNRASLNPLDGYGFQAESQAKVGPASLR